MPSMILSAKMLDEAHLLKELDHVCIPKVIWVGDADSEVHIVREMV